MSFRRLSGSYEKFVLERFSELHEILWNTLCTVQVKINDIYIAYRKYEIDFSRLNKYMHTSLINSHYLSVSTYINEQT